MLNLQRKNYFEIIFFLLIIILIFFRSPCFFLEGSLKTDDYDIYNSSISNDFFENLFYIFPGYGTINFSSNIYISAISLFSIESAKLVSSYTIVSIYFLIVLFTYYSNSIFLKNYKQKIFAIFVIIFSPSMTPEIWMAGTHLRSYFGILSFILLFQNHKGQSNFFNNTSNFLVFFSGISSIYASALTPAYFLRFYFNKNKQNFYRFLFALIAMLMQLYVVIDNIDTSLSVNRFQVELGTFYSYLYNVPVRSFFGSTIPKMLFVNTEIYTLKKFNIFLLISSFTLFIVGSYYLIKKKDEILFLILLSLIGVSGLIIIGTLEPGFVGGRYAVIPGIIYIFLILRLFEIEKYFFLKVIFAILLLTSASIGFVEYKYLSPLPDSLKCL